MRSSFLMASPALIFIREASSPTVISSGTVMESCTGFGLKAGCCPRVRRWSFRPRPPPRRSGPWSRVFFFLIFCLPTLMLAASGTKLSSFSSYLSGLTLLVPRVSTTRTSVRERFCCGCRSPPDCGFRLSRSACRAASACARSACSLALRAFFFSSYCLKNSSMLTSCRCVMCSKTRLSSSGSSAVIGLFCPLPAALSRSVISFVFTPRSFASALILYLSAGVAIAVTNPFSLNYDACMGPWGRFPPPAGRLRRIRRPETPRRTGFRRRRRARASRVCRRSRRRRPCNARICRTRACACFPPRPQPAARAAHGPRARLRPSGRRRRRACRLSAPVR